MKHSHLWKFWFGAWLLLFAALAQAALSQIHTLSGSVAITYPGQAARPAQKGDRLEVGTVVATGEKSFAMLRFEDGQVVALKSNSEFRVDQYRFNPKVDQDNKAGFTVSKGGLRAITGLIGKKNPDGFKLDTPTATIGIRGTTFDIFIDGGTFIRVTDGRIAIVNPAGLLELAAGQLAAITSSQTPPAPTTEGELPPGARAGFQEIEGIVVNNLPPTSAGGAGDLGGALGGASEIVTAPPPPPPSPPPTTTPPPPPAAPTAAVAPLSLDVFFLADNTGSMSWVISQMQENASTILNKLADLSNITMRWGVGRYLGDPTEAGETPISAYQLMQPMTTDKTLVQAAINDWYASGGGDWEEANFYALQQVATNGAGTPRDGSKATGQNTGWSANAQSKVIVVFGDAPSWQNSVNEQELGQVLKASGVSVSFIDTLSMNEGDDSPDTWRNLSTWANAQAKGAAQELADLTDGVYIRLPEGYTAENLSSAVVAAVFNPLSSKTLPFSGGHMNHLGWETWRSRTALSVLAAPDATDSNLVNFVLTYPLQPGAEFTLDTTAGVTVTGRDYKLASGTALSGVDIWDRAIHEDSFVQWTTNAASQPDFYRFLLYADDCEGLCRNNVVEGYFGTKLASLPGSGVTVFDLFSRARDPEEDASYGTGATPSGELSVNWANKKGVRHRQGAPERLFRHRCGGHPDLGFFHRPGQRGQQDRGPLLRLWALRKLRP